MAQWFDGIMRSLGYAPMRGARKYAGAVQSRLSNGWTTQSISADQEIRYDLEALRARARDLCINNDYGKKFLQMVESNVVGPAGFQLQSMATLDNGQPDTIDRRAIETAFYDWCQPQHCDVSRRLSFVDIQRLVVKSVARDGEAIVRRVRDKSFKYGYKLQVLDIDRLDVKYNDSNQAAQVRMGVELDSYGAPVAYWLLTRHPGDIAAGGAQLMRERVPADDLLHIYRADRPEQRRGVPWLHSVMASLKNLEGYQEAAIIAARVGASKMGFFQSPDGSAPMTLVDGEEAQDSGTFVTDAEPGRFDVLPQGYTFQAFNPDYPSQNYDVFVKSVLRSIASGLGVAYNSLSNDLEGVNFSSIRAGVLEERDNWMVLQNWLIDAFLAPVFADWLNAALLKGAITMPGGSPLPAYKLPKYQAHAWQPRRWQWVDPSKDIDAAVTAINNGLDSPQRIAASQGRDIEDVLDELAAYQAMLDGKGIELLAHIKAAPPAPAAPQVAPEQQAANGRSFEMLDKINRRLERVEDKGAAPQPAAPDVNVTVGATAEETANLVREIIEPVHREIGGIAKEIREMQINVNVPEQAPPVVNVAPAAVSVVNEVQPAAVEVSVAPVLQMPARKTTTQIIHDAEGNIVKTIQTETDA